MKILIVNGPNLNLLGTREPELYGTKSFNDYFTELKKLYPSHNLEYVQSNVEGEIINHLQNAIGKFDGIILNAGGYTHTSVAIADAISAIGIPVIEVHISNIYSRQEYRHVSLTGKNCAGVITGFGLDSYRLGMEAFLKK